MLGLAIADEIVRRHEGRIEVTSEGVPGKGTAFTIWLPAPEAKPSANENGYEEKRNYEFADDSNN